MRKACCSAWLEDGASRNRNRKQKSGQFTHGGRRARQLSTVNGSQDYDARISLTVGGDCKASSTRVVNLRLKLLNPDY